MIMIVDDNPRMRNIIKKHLGQRNADEGYFECDNLRTAVDAYERLRPDWILIDMNMDSMEGLRVTERIRKKFPDAHIIIVADFDDRELNAAAQAAGATGYVSKERLFELQGLLR